MAYNEQLADRVRELLVDRDDVTEKGMFGGLCFMVDDKMCVCVTSQGLLCRIGEEKALIALEKSDCSQMINNGRVMKALVYVDHGLVQNSKNLQYWVNLCLEFNPLAKSSRKKR